MRRGYQRRLLAWLIAVGTPVVAIAACQTGGDSSQPSSTPDASSTDAPAASSDRFSGSLDARADRDGRDKDATSDARDADAAADVDAGDGGLIALADPCRGVALPLDLAFFDEQPAGALPERWRGGAFIAMHGSIHRDASTGYRIVWQPFLADGSSPIPTSTATTTTFAYEPVFGSGNTLTNTILEGSWTWQIPSAEGERPRPSAVAISPVDGALYVASDADGYVYRLGLKKN